MIEIALPRIKTKRRKRRPPSRREKLAMALSTWVIGWTIYDIVIYSTHGLSFDGIWDIIAACINMVIFRYVWPPVWNYIKNGFIDE
jgi:hypothetical protein